MRTLQRRLQALAGRGVPQLLRGLLRARGGRGAPAQGTGRLAAGGDHAGSGLTHPGADLGVRAPAPGETPLSAAEVEFALRRGLL